MPTRRVRTVASVVAVGLAVSSMVAFAVLSDGNATRKVDLNDSGVWVTSNDDGMFGRVNKTAGALDALVNAGGLASTYDLDVMQDRSAIVARNVAGGQLLPVSSAAGIALKDQAVDVPPGMVVDMRGGTIAVLDPPTGNLWATRYDSTQTVTTLTALASTAKPLASLGAAPKDDPGAASYAALAVGTDGTVHAISRTGKTATIVPDGPMSLGKPVLGTVAGSLKSVRMSAVGSTPVILDAVGSTLVVGDRSVQLPQSDAKAVLGRPVSSGDATVATTRALYAVNAAGTGDAAGAVRTLMSDGTGTPAAPVVVRGCLLAAWAGSPGTLVSSCDHQSVQTLPLERAKTLVAPVFRTNRDDVVLNDTSTGRIFDLDQLKSIDNWKDIQQSTKDAQEQTKPQVANTVDDKKNKPKAKADDWGARPGRTTILHLLDNDTDPQGRILTIQSVGAPSNPHADVVVSPDGQSVRYTLDATGGDSSFSYTISNGINTAQGPVQVRSVPAAENTAPRRRPIPYPSLAVAAGGTIPVQIVADWRDFEGDPITIVSAATDDTVGHTVATPDGKIEYSSNDEVKASTQKVTYKVTDGEAEGQAATFDVKLLGSGALEATPPITQPDVARGEVGRPIAVSPLVNDTQGADPLSPQAALVLAGPVAQKAGFTVDTDLASGEVMVTASRPGTFFLDYSAGFGTALAKGTIRIDADKAGTRKDDPVAMPDFAAVHGQSAVVVDVLANDTDPVGSMLTVVSAEPVTADQVQVAVVRGRWLRIQPTVAKFDKPAVVRYRITNGRSGIVTGETIVSQLDPLASDPPVTRPDYAVVRDADSTVVNVLDNDTTQAGSPLHLLVDPDSAADIGKLSVTDPSAKAGAEGDLGTAYVAGDAIRYVAPGKVTGPKTVFIDYVAVNDAGEKAQGRLEVSITPQPGAGNENQVPTPRPLEGRVVAGESITIQVPPSNNDPDGDSTTVVGIASPPALGRVTGFSPTGITYQAYPTSTGTDSFSYVVVDRYGLRATSLVRVAVNPPGIPQLAVPVDDVLVAAPGATVTVAPLLNDLYGKSDPVHLTPLANSNAAVPAGVSLDPATNVVTLTAPAASARPLEVRYTIVGNGGESIPGTISLSSQEKFENPPRVFDQVGALTDKNTVEVDVLRGAFDPDGDSAKLQVTKVADPTAKINGGKVTFPVLDRPQAVPFEVTDEAGAVSAAVVYIPAAGVGAPYLKPGSLIKVDQGGKVTAALKDYVIDPRGRPVTLTIQGRLWASPSQGLGAAPASNESIALTAQKDYIGPGAVVVEVIDGKLDDPTALKSVISIPVQVGPDTPVLRCPDDVYTVYAGGDVRTLDVASVCSVWTPTDAMAKSLTFSGAWSKEIPAVSIKGQRTRSLVIDASGSAKPNSAGAISVTADGTQAKPATLNVQVLAAAKPRLAAIKLAEMKQGDTRTVNIADYLTSPLKDKQVTVFTAVKTTGDAATITASGSTVSITPGANSHGPMLFTVTVSDLADRARTDRVVSGTIAFSVFGRPDKPKPPAAKLPSVSTQAALTWIEPPSNGAPITGYRIEWAGGSTSSTRPAVTATGLTNGTAYRFRVQAINKAGDSDWSEYSAAYTPDEAPKSVPGFNQTAAGPHSITLSWEPAVNNGSALTGYVISGASRTTKVAGTATSTTITVPDNTQIYPFSIIATNAKGQSAASSAKAFAQGVPIVSGVQTLPVDPVDSATTAVTVDWTIDAQVPSSVPVRYTVTRSGPGGAKTVLGDQPDADTQVQDTGVEFGRTYTYTVTAATTVLGKTVTSAKKSTTVTPVGRPAAWTSFTAVPTGDDGTAQLDFSVPASRGAKNSKVFLLRDGREYVPLGEYPPSGAAGQTETKSIGSNGTDYALALKVCNEVNMCSTSPTITVNPYGRIPPPEISLSKDGPTTFQVHVNANGNGRTVHVHVWTDSGHAWDTTTVGSAHWDFGGYGVSYSQGDTAHVTISDSAGRAVPGQVNSNSLTADPPPAPSGQADQNGSDAVLHYQNMPSGSSWVVRCWNASGSTTYRWATDFRGEVRLALSGSGSATFRCPTLPTAGRPFSIEVQGQLWSSPITWR